MLDSLIHSNLSHTLVTLLLSMLPISELRGALPVAILSFDMPWYQAYPLCVAGNLLPVPLLLLFFGSVARLISKIPAGKRFIDWLLTRTAKRTGNIEKYKFAGLMLFVAIPLPITGAWTASLAAYILGVPFWRAFLSIALGVLCAGVIVTILTMLGWLGAAIAIVALILIVSVTVWRMVKTKRAS
jgi:uncharacterized membrane protein